MPTKSLNEQLALIDIGQSDITVDEQSAIAELVDELRRIDERADIAVNTVTQAIRTQAVVAKGRALLEVEKRLEGFTEKNRNSRLLPMLASLGGPDERTAKTWMAAAISVEQNAFLAGGEDFLLNFSPAVLSKLHSLPASKRADVIEDAVENGTKITAKKVNEVAAQPDTKAEAKEEELQAAKEEAERLSKELEALRRDMTVVTDDPEYQRAVSAQQAAVAECEKLSEQVEQLKKESRTYKQQAYEANKKLGEVEQSTEEQEAEAKKIRIRKISSTLPNRIPDVLADIQRFYSEQKDYDSEVQQIIVDQIKTLAAFIVPHYVNS